MTESEAAESAPVFVDPFLKAETFNPELGTELRLQTLTFENQNGTSLFGRYWKPKGQPKALVCVVHGFGEYLVSYHEVSLTMAEQGCLVFGHDHMGHGRSGGERATQASIDNFAADVVQHVRMVAPLFPGAALFLVGHSMGGMITLLTVEREPRLFKGIVLVGPFISMPWTITLPIQKLLAIVLCRFSPSLTVGNIDVDSITSDEVSREKIRNDPLWWKGSIKAQMAVAFINGMKRLSSSMDNLNIPMLIIHGEKDMLCDPDGSKRLYTSSKATDKELKIYPQALHHLFLETKEIREMAVKDTVDWIMKRV